MPVATSTRTIIMAVAAVLATGALLFLAWFAWATSVFSQGDAGECRVVFTQVHDNIDVDQTAEYRWSSENADPNELRIVAPDGTVATLESSTQTTATILGVAQGVSELTVSVYCTNEKQEGQWIATTAPVVVGGADGSHLDSWPPEEGSTGDQAAPDLQVMHATVIPNSAIPGAEVRIGAEVHNEGTSSSSATKLRFYRSTNAIISGLDTEIGVNDIPVVRASRHWASVHYFNAPADAGTYYYGACVDTFTGESITFNNCSSAATLTVTQFGFTPDPLELGDTSNVWTVPASVSRLYLDVDYAVGSNKDPSGDILIQRVNSSNTVLETHAVDSENDSGSLPTNFTKGERIRIEIENDAFDTHASAVALTFHSGTSVSGAEIAVANVQKEQRPFAPRNGSSTVNHTGTGTVTLTWSKGEDRDYDNPDHYRLEIPDTANPGTFLYTDYYISDSNDPTTYTITNARSHGLEGTHLVHITHCNSVGGCSFIHGISFTLNPEPPPDTPEPPTPIPTATPLSKALPPPNIRLTRDTSSLLTIAWDDGTGVANYQARHSDDGVTWKTSGELPITTKTYSATGVRSGKSYEFQVRSKGDGSARRGDWGDWSASHHYSVPYIELLDVINSLEVGDVDEFSVHVTDLNEERDYAMSAHADNESGLGSQGENEEDPPAVFGRSDCSVKVLRQDLASGIGHYTWDLEMKGCAEGRARITGMIRDRTGINDADDYREVARVTANVRVDPMATPTPVATATPTPEPPPKPTSLSLSVDPTTASRLVFKYQPSLWSRSSNHHYTLELQKSGSSGAVQTQNATVSGANAQSGFFTGITPGEKYRARAQRCPDSNFTNCGDWSDWVVIPPPPTSLSLARHSNDPLAMDYRYTATSWDGVAGKTKGHQLELEQQNSDGTWSSQGIVSSSSSPHAFTGLTGGGTYRVRARQCGDASNDLCGYWTVWVEKQLNQVDAPDVSVVPIGPNADGNRQARLIWDHVSPATSYEIQRLGSSTISTPKRLGTILYHDLDLDFYLRFPDRVTFTIRALTTGSNYAGNSTVIHVVDTPITRLDGGGAGGRVEVMWESLPTGATDRRLLFRKVKSEHSDDDFDPYDYDPVVSSASISVAEGAIQPVSGLETEAVYAVQLTYRNAQGENVFAGRSSYVWIAARMPRSGERVSTYPFFGHWPNRTYSYRICQDTFLNNPATSTDETQVWANLINAAFDEWETATNNLVTGTQVMPNTDCGLGKVTSNTPLPPNIIVPPPPFFRSYSAALVDASVNEIYMVDGPKRSQFHFAGFIRQLPGVCVFHGPACVISQAYGTDAEAANDLSASGVSVDILINKATLEPFEAANNLGIPTATSFNHCAKTDAILDSATVYPFRLMLHEAGHAFGLSGFSVPVTLRTFDIYEQAHPTVASSVMNYDKEASVGDEPDCSPHPLDIMALWALYQTTN